MMSVPPHYTQTVRGEPPAEDCRDFLRTGRCKYGASCKYNHPSNVQSGGGMKAPINPSEPMFPVRPNEPTCQYFMKHGTCKFGQACKFHHPPQSAVTTALLSGNAVVMNVGRGEAGSQQILLNSIGGETATASGVTLQFLPQRPNEPDCIYFLRNGRCKYGATCRYHHPVAVNQRKQRVDVQGSPLPRRQPHPTQLVAHPIPVDSATQDRIRAPPNYSQVTRAPSKPSAPVRYVVSDGQFAVVTVNNSSSSPGSQYLQVPEGTEYFVTTGAPAAPGMRHESSSSSVSSSYETASSGFEYIAQQGDQGGPGVWVRNPRVGSGGSLNTLSETESTTHGHQTTVMYRSGSLGALAHSSSEASLTGRNRGESFGSSASAEGARVHPESAARTGSGPPPPGMRVWAEAGRRVKSHGTMHSHPSTPIRHRHVEGDEAEADEEHHEGADEGLSMMTSALLNMLDTPEEAATKSYTQALIVSTSPPSTPRNGPTAPPEGQLSTSPSSSHSGSQGQLTSRRVAASSRYTFTAEGSPEDYRSRRPPGLVHPSASPVQANRQLQRDDLNGPRWSPTWPTPQQAQELEENNQAMSALQQQPPDANSHHTSSNVGLYLP